MSQPRSVPEFLGDASVYADLKKLARRQLLRRPAGSTLDTTALVHEACIKLAAPNPDLPTDPAHRMNLAAQAMRQVLCDHARRRLVRLNAIESMDPADLAEIPVETPDTLADARRLLAIDALLTTLAKHQPERAYVFSARFFAGLSAQEVADASGMCLRTVQREWQVGKEWIRERLARQDDT